MTLHRVSRTGIISTPGLAAYHFGIETLAYSLAHQPKDPGQFKDFCSDTYFAIEGTRNKYFAGAFLNFHSYSVDSNNRILRKSLHTLTVDELHVVEEQLEKIIE